MEETIQTTPEMPELVEVVDIQFRQGQKVYYFDPAGAVAEFGATGGVDNHMIAHSQLKTCGIKIVYLLSGAELDVYHLYGLVFFSHKRFFSFNGF